MGLSSVKEQKLLYHLTALEHLESIFNNGLMSRIDIVTAELDFVDIADHRILEGRAVTALDEYIPFHFHPYTAFDTFVKRNNEDVEFIYLCLNRTYARRIGMEIIPIHPLSKEKIVEIYSWNQGFRQIDWKAMSTVGNDDDYIKNVKMAEAICHRKIEFCCIYVSSENTRQYIETFLKEKGYDSPYPSIYVRPNLF